MTTPSKGVPALETAECSSVPSIATILGDRGTDVIRVEHLAAGVVA